MAKPKRAIRPSTQSFTLPKHVDPTEEVGTSSHPDSQQDIGVRHSTNSSPTNQGSTRASRRSSPNGTSGGPDHPGLSTLDEMQTPFTQRDDAQLARARRQQNAPQASSRPDPQDLMAPTHRSISNLAKQRNTRASRLLPKNELADGFKDSSGPRPQQHAASSRSSNWNLSNSRPSRHHSQENHTKGPNELSGSERHENIGPSRPTSSTKTNPHTTRIFRRLALAEVTHGATPKEESTEEQGPVADILKGKIAVPKPRKGGNATNRPKKPKDPEAEKAAKEAAKKARVENQLAKKRKRDGDPGLENLTNLISLPSPTKRAKYEQDQKHNLRNHARQLQGVESFIRSPSSRHHNKGRKEHIKNSSVNKDTIPESLPPLAEESSLNEILTAMYEKFPVELQTTVYSKLFAGIECLTPQSNGDGGEYILHPALLCNQREPEPQHDRFIREATTFVLKEKTICVEYEEQSNWLYRWLEEIGLDIESELVKIQFSRFSNGMEPPEEHFDFLAKCSGLEKIGFRFHWADVMTVDTEVAKLRSRPIHSIHRHRVARMEKMVEVLQMARLEGLVRRLKAVNNITLVVGHNDRTWIDFDWLKKWFEKSVVGKINNSTKGTRSTAHRNIVVSIRDSLEESQKIELQDGLEEDFNCNSKLESKDVSTPGSKHDSKDDSERDSKDERNWDFNDDSEDDEDAEPGASMDYLFYSVDETVDPEEEREKKKGKGKGKRNARRA